MMLHPSGCKAAPCPGLQMLPARHLQTWSPEGLEGPKSKFLHVMIKGAPKLYQIQVRGMKSPDHIPRLSLNAHAVIRCGGDRNAPAVLIPQELPV